MNDRALRSDRLVAGRRRQRLSARGRVRHHRRFARVMAILCLSLSLEDLQRRLANIIVGSTRERKPVRASELKARRRDDGAVARMRSSPISCRRSRTIPPSSMAGLSPTSPTAATRSWRRSWRSSLPITSSPRPASAPISGAEKFFDIKCRKAGLQPVDGGGGRDHPRPQVPRRRRAERSRQGERRGGDRRHGQPASATSRTSGISACPRWSPSTASARTPTAEWPPRSTAARRLGVTACRLRALGQGQQGRGRSSGACRRRRHRRQARPISSRSIPTRCRWSTRSGPSPSKIYGAGEDRGAEGGRPTASRSSRRGLRPSADVHGQDAVQLLRRSRPARRARAGSSCRCARCGFPPAPSSWSRSAATS